MLIIASLGQNITEDKIRKIILSGADVLRFNFSHHTPEKNIQLMHVALHIADNLNSSVKMMVDFPIDKPRLGYFDAQLFAVQEHKELILQSAEYSPDCNEFLPINIPHLGKMVVPHQIVAIGDGEVSVQITEIISPDAVKALVLNNGMIRYLKTFNLNSNGNNHDGLIETYQKILQELASLRPEFLAMSYINQTFVARIKALVPHHDSHTKLIIKIEKSITDAEIDTLCHDAFFDVILIDRGEMGVNIPFEQVGILQKKIMAVARKYHKAIFVSTQILSSTTTNYIPNRSEILDLTNITLDGAAGIVLCYETGSGQRPAYTISVAKKIIEETKKYKTNGD